MGLNVKIDTAKVNIITTLLLGLICLKSDAVYMCPVYMYVYLRYTFIIMRDEEGK